MIQVILFIPCIPSIHHFTTYKPQTAYDQYEYMKHTFLFIILILCILFSVFVPVSAEYSPPDHEGFGAISFCSDVSTTGDPLYVSDTFPSDSKQVLAYIPYTGMKDGESWGMYWTVDGEEYADERNQAWELGSEGWVSYDITRDGVLKEGVWHVDLYRGDTLVSSAECTISSEISTPLEEPSSIYQDNAGFGRIQFAESLSDEQIPVDPSDTFQYGITEISAYFPYFGMSDGISWTREWLHDDEEFVKVDDTWSEGREGVTSRNMGYESEDPLDPGTYTLNLYINGQLARSAEFTVLQPEPEQEQTAIEKSPDELIDKELLPAWTILDDSPTPVVREIAELAVKNQIEIRLVDEGNAIAWYRYEKGTKNIGDVYVKRSKFNQYSRIEVASTIAHELTHAMQHVEKGVDMHCSVENEYYAYIVELYVLLDNGRKDLIYHNWSGLFDDNWKFDSTKLWAALKKAYDSCPEY